MAFRLIQADQNIIDGVQFIMEGVEPVSGFNRGRKIQIQFPPRIKTKTKTANYKLKDDKGFYEPVAVWKGATGTQISVEFKYVVTGGAWGIREVSGSVHDIMGYFYKNVAVQNVEADTPLITVVMYEIIPAGQGGGQGGTKLSKWRMENATVSYSDELVTKDGLVYPQVTTVALSMVMVTKIRGDTKGAEPEKQRVKAPPVPLKEWY